MSTEWRPEGVDRPYARRERRPAVGDVVAFLRRAWEVVHVADADPTPEEAASLAGILEPWRTQRAPFRVTLRRLHGEPSKHENERQEVGYRIPAGYQSWLKIYPSGRVPLCSCHGHPWPCLEADQQKLAEKELERAEAALNLPPGCCPACKEPVTTRQRSITFGGPNVTNPLAEGPTFHLRRKCYGSAAAYEEKWVTAEPGRRRSLLTLRCEGTVVVHADGTGECFGAAGSDCPSIYAFHRASMACYYQSHGCGQGCPPGGHGTRLAGRPDDPRAVLGPEVGP